MSDKKQQHFDEVNVGRMNIVDDNGTIRMALSNKDKFPAPFELDGKPVPREGHPRAGVILYNDEGIECGGLTFSGEKDENGEVSQQALLSLDPYLQNDAIDLGVADLNGKREMVLNIHDRPTFPITELAEKIMELENASEEERNAFFEKAEEQGDIGRNRISVAKRTNGEAEIKLSDSKGNPRIRAAVDENDEPKLEFLKEDGEVIRSFT